MSRQRGEPLVARNFQVRFVLHGPRGGSVTEREVDVSQVVFPPLRLDGRSSPPVRDVIRGGSSRGTETGENLVLRRGHTGSSEFYELSHHAERDNARQQVRDVTVVLLDEDFEPVTGWHFAGCHIVSLDYAPFDALDLSVFTESLELSFKSVDQIKL